MSTAYDDSLWRVFYRKCMPFFEGTPQHQYYKDLVRDEVEQAHLQALRELLPMIVQPRFPTLTRLAETQAMLIKDMTVIEEVMCKVSKAQTTEEAMNALLSCLPDDDLEE